MPPAGVIDNRTLLALATGRAATVAWLPRRLAARARPPPEHPAASNPSIAHATTVAALRPRSPTDRKQMGSGIAAGRNF